MTEHNKHAQQSVNYDQSAPQPEAHEAMNDEVPKNISSSMASPYALDPDAESAASTSPSED